MADLIDEALRWLTAPTVERFQMLLDGPPAALLTDEAQDYLLTLRDEVDIDSSMLVHEFRALLAWTRDAGVVEAVRRWAWAQHDLAYRIGHRGQDRGLDLEFALSLLHTADEVLALGNWTAERAQISQDLGNAYQERLLGDSTENLTRSVEYFERALALTTDPATRALIDGDLGGTHTLLAAHDRSTNVRKAVEHLSAALAFWNRQGDAPQRSITLNNLAAALLTGTPTPDEAELAVTHLRQAVEIESRQGKRLQWAHSLGNLGRAHGLQGDLRSAEDAFRASVEALVDLRDWDSVRRFGYQWGRLLEDMDRPAEAARRYLDALEAADELYRSALVARSRETELSANDDLHLRACDALVRAGLRVDAVLVLERWRVRALGEVVARERFAEAGEEYVRATERLRAAEAADRAQVSGDVTRELIMARRAHAEAATAAGLVTSMDAEALRSLVLRIGTPLVYVVSTHSRNLCLVVSLDDDERLDVQVLQGELSRASMVSLLWRDGGQSGYLPSLFVPPGDGEPALIGALDEVLHALGQHAATPLAEHLTRRGLRNVVVIPCGEWGLLPLHAAVVDGRATCLLDHVVVQYAPSARVLAALPEATSAAPALVGVANPTGDLPYAHVELDGIARRVPAHPLHGREATTRALLDLLPTADHVHLACHARYVPSDPLDSAIELADGTLTLRDLLSRRWLDGTRLVFASTCVSAVAHRADLPDEAMSLLSGLLHAGAHAAIGSLWPVDDLVTAVVANRFYAEYLDPAGSPTDPAAALRRAQLWLRDATTTELAAEVASLVGREPVDSGEDRPWSHPADWAAFVVVGGRLHHR